ncbi:MAG: hypothetical protein LBS55_14385, partial [Prevotellaceae bacterium]|nr:hypothetical protein [Prevotellaceae bacterium]
MLSIVFLISGAFLCLLFFYIHKTKSYGLIAGYPEAGSKRRKEADRNIDIAGLARYMKNAAFIWFFILSAGFGVLEILG